MKSVKSVRTAIESEYDVVDGIIRNPGKFEGEAVWVPYFWDLAMAYGEGEEVFDEDGELAATRFRVDAEEEDAFADVMDGELACGSTVELFEDAQGFVIGTVIS